MAYDILQDVGQPLHINDIIRRIASRFGADVDRESLVSALSKRVMRHDRFLRTAKNTFAVTTAAATGEATKEQGAS